MSYFSPLATNLQKYNIVTPIKLGEMMRLDVTTSH